MGRIRIYIAASLDGYIAGEGDDLSWLPRVDDGPPPDPDAVTFEAFMADVGALLMGRRTFDVLSGFEGPWPYGDTPILVATHRNLTGAPATVRAVNGTMDDLLDRALEVAAGKDVYVDGGRMVQQALDTGRVDELILTLVPTLLGRGVPLFGPLKHPPLGFVFSPPARYGPLVQLKATRGENGRRH